MITIPQKNGSKPGIEVLGPWLHNKGDVLNIHAVARQLLDTYSVAVSSNLGLDDFPTDPELSKVLWPPSTRDLLRAARHANISDGLSMARRGLELRIATDAQLQQKKVVDGRKLVGLIDCSGFAYGDQWNPARTLRRAEYYAKIKKRDTRLILLPQAFGPFNNKASQDSTVQALSQFDLIYARDSVSLEHLHTLDLSPSKISLAPDITHLVEPTPPQNSEEWRDRVCIVPNERMLDRTDDKDGTRYISQIKQAIDYVASNGYEPCFVLHETNDRPMVDRLNDSLSEKLPVFDDHALVTKGYLGSCRAVVGSRYHALLSSLSQGTPCLGTSWNHKYEEMFADYNCPEMLLSNNASKDDLQAILDRLLNEQSTLRNTLTEAAAVQKAKVKAMWEQVETVLNPAATLSA